MDTARFMGREEKKKGPEPSFLPLLAKEPEKKGKT